MIFQIAEKQEKIELTSMALKESFSMSLVELKKSSPNVYLFQSGESYHISSIENEELFFSHPKYFNDPYDCDFTIENDLYSKKSAQGHDVKDLKALFKANYSNGINGNWDSILLSEVMATKVVEWCDDIIDSYELINVLEGHIKESVGVRCFFEEKPESVLMWAHYANDHKGYCLGYELPVLSKAIMDYSTEKPVFYLSEFLFSSRLTIHRLINNKDSVWAYEKEVRMASLCNDAVQKASKGFNEELSKIDASLSAIYLGASIGKELEEQLTSIAQSKGVSLFKCKKHDYRRSTFILYEV